MKVELKKVSFSERLSQETYAFVADIYINGKRAGEAKNDGRGGSTHCRLDDRALDAEFEAYAKSLPDKTYPARPGTPSFTVKMDAEGLINELFDQWLAERDSKTMQRKIANYAKKNAAKGFPVCAVFKKDGKVTGMCSFKTQDDAAIRAKLSAGESYEIVS